MNLIGKAAVVFGGSRGVGRACAIQLAQNGADVAIVYRGNDQAAEEAAELVRRNGQKAMIFSCDIADSGAVKQVYKDITEQFGAFQMLVSSAGILIPYCTTRQTDPEDWKKFMSVDLNGTFFVIHYALPYLTDNGGAIVVISSVASQSVPLKNPHGAAGKAGVEALTKVVAREEAKNGIRANVVAIGMTTTDMLEEVFGHFGAEKAQRAVEKMPLGRLGAPEDAANAVTFLLSEQGAYITGKVFQIDGGQHIG